MLSLRLWQALQRPPIRHPLFQRAVGVDRVSQRLTRFVENLAPTVLLFGLFLCVGMWFLPRLVLLPRLFIVWSVMPLAFILVTGTLFGAMWASNIGRTIASEYAKKRYDLLCLSPSGKMIANWAICTACLYRNQLFSIINMQRNTIIGQLILPIFILLVIGFTLSAPVRGEALAINTVNYSVAVVLFFADYIHSLVLCSLIGMLAPAIARNSLNAPLWAAGGFLLVQLTSYMLIAVICFVILPMIYGAVQASGTYAEISMTLLRLLIFFALREGLIALLWRFLQQKLNVDGVEVDAAFRLAR